MKRMSKNLQIKRMPLQSLTQKNHQFIIALLSNQKHYKNEKKFNHCICDYHIRFRRMY